jgi:signal transduction histidine kinase
MSEPRTVGARSAQLLVVACAICAAAAGAIALWDPIDIVERTHLRRASREAARRVREDLAADFRLEFLALARLASAIAAEDSRHDDTHDVVSRLIVGSEPGDLSLQWIDPSNAERWSARAASALTIQLPPFDRDDALQDAIRTAGARQEPVLSPAIVLPDGRVAARIVAPALRNGVPAGFIVATIDASVALRSMLASHHALGYAVTVTDDGLQLFGSDRDQQNGQNDWIQDEELVLPGIRWHIRVWPTREAINEIRSSLPELAFAVGGLLGILLFATLNFARLARIRSQQLERTHAILEQRVHERTQDLQRMNEDLQNQVTERARAEAALHGLSGRLLQLQDEERRRIARELHDSTGAFLSALSLNLERVQRLAGHGQDAAFAAIVRDSTSLIARTTRELRTLSHLLHPPMLDELGLDCVLPWYVTGFAERSGLAVTCDVQPALCIPSDIELTLFRIVQEALTNVHRHSQSASASVRVWREDQRVLAEISDRGRGIPPAILQQPGQLTAEIGIGIAGMRERVRQLHGEFDIVGSTNGTTVRVIIPMTTAPRLEATVNAVTATTLDAVLDPTSVSSRANPSCAEHPPESGRPAA